MDKKTFTQLLAMAERLGIITAAELLRFKNKHKAHSNAEMFNALFMAVIKKEELKGA